LQMDLRSGLLMAFLMGLLMFTGYLVGGGSPYFVLMFFGIALLINVGTYWFSDRVVLRMYRARVLDEGENLPLQNMVGGLAVRAGIPKPKVALIPSDVPNAFATGRGPSSSVVAVTRGALDLLSEPELEGVLGHELSHIKNRDTLIMVLAAAIAGAIGYIAFAARWSLLMGGNRRNDGGAGLIALLLLAVLVPIAALIVRLAISRGREYLADRGGAEISGRPGGLASALSKIENSVGRRPVKGGNPATSHLFIVNPFRGDTLTSIFSTHPPTQERIKRLRAMEQEQSFGKIY
jgi:heat shock protein HtpX